MPPMLYCIHFKSINQIEWKYSAGFDGCVGARALTVLHLPSNLSASRSNAVCIFEMITAVNRAMARMGEQE